MGLTLDGTICVFVYMFVPCGVTLREILHICVGVKQLAMPVNRQAAVCSYSRWDYVYTCIFICSPYVFTLRGTLNISVGVRRYRVAKTHRIP